MPLYESPAIILRGMKLGETDKIITFFTRRFGKIKAVAKGTTRPKSRFGGRVEPLVYCTMIAFAKENANLFRLNSCDLIEPFSALRNDLDKLNRAFVMAELVDVSQKERDVNQRGFDLLLAVLRRFTAETSRGKLDLLLRLAELKHLSIIGFRPTLDRCVDCGAGIEGRAGAGFNSDKGGAVCHNCLARDPSARRLSAGALMLMSQGLKMSMEKTGRLSADPAMMADISAVVKEFAQTHTRRNLKSERFLTIFNNTP